MTEPADHEIVQALKKLRYDLTAMQAKVSDLLTMAAALNLEPAEVHACRCGLRFPSQRRLAEHVYTSHDGPEPEHWRQTEGAAE